MHGDRCALNPNVVFVTLITLGVLFVLGWFVWPTRYDYSVPMAVIRGMDGFAQTTYTRRDRFTGCLEHYDLKANEWSNCRLLSSIPPFPKQQ